MRRWRWGLLSALVLILGGCKRGTPSPDGGRSSASPPVARDAGPVRTVPGPLNSAAGPRIARPVEIFRIPDLKQLRRQKRFAGVVRFIERATRDVYGSRSFVKQVEAATGEKLREPQALVLERLSVGPGAELWRVTFEAWCGPSTVGSAGYKSDHLLLSRARKKWRLVAAYRPGCDESGEPEVARLDLDGDGREDLISKYASTRLGEENRLEIKWLKRTSRGFLAQRILREGSPFQTLAVRYAPDPGRGRALHFRTFRETSAGCAFFEMTVTYTLDKAKGIWLRGKENIRPVSSKTLLAEGEDVDPRCEPKKKR